MRTLSDRHHEVPRWLLSHFAAGSSMLWVGFKRDRRLRLISTRDAFVRRGANSRFEYVPQADGSLRRVKSDKAERDQAAFDSLSCDAARELIKFARRWRDLGFGPHELTQLVVDISKRLILVQARRTRDAQERISIGDHDPVLIADVVRVRADELGVELPCTQELIEDPEIAGLFKEVSQNNRATFAGGQHPLDLQKEVELLAQRGLRIAVALPSVGDFVIGSHGLTTGRTINGRDSWLPIAPDVAIAHSDMPGDVKIRAVPGTFVEWHNRAALSISERVGGSLREMLEDLLATLD